MGADAQMSLEMEGRGFLQDHIPNVGKLELASVPFMG